MRTKNLILAILFLLLSTPLYAQKLTMGYLYPAGGEVGTTVEIEAGGLNINRATKVLFSHPGIKGVVEPIKESASAKRKRRRLNDQSSPQLADRVKIRITIGKMFRADCTTCACKAQRVCRICFRLKWLRFRTSASLKSRA